MTSNDAIPLRNLAIYLLHEKVRRPADAFRDAEGLQVLPIVLGSTRIGDLYLQPAEPKPPRWARLFKGVVELDEFGRVGVSSAVLLIATKGRLFALAFGQGRHLLKPGAWEERFGLKVALNSIDENRLRSIDKRTFDAIARHTRVQASREARAPDFGLDVEQDLLRAVTGTPRHEQLGKRLSGMDALHMLVRTDLGGLRSVLARALEAFHATTYRRAFPWVDQIAEVSSPSLVSALDDLFVQQLRENKADRCWLAVPEILDWTRCSGFRYSFRPRAAEYHDLYLTDFLGSLEDDDRDLSPEILRKRRVYCVGADGEQLDEWPIYQCLYCEVDHDGDTYVLNDGKWYRVNRQFVRIVNAEFEGIPRWRDSLPEYDDDSEEEYCDRVARESPDRYALMDRKTIRIGGAYNKIEFCDLFSSTRDLIHVKRYGGSSVFSHLFAQGLVSAESFRGEATFRGDVNRLLPEAYRFADPLATPDPAAFQVVYAIIKDSAREFTIPFFSKVNLRHAARRLDAYGFRVALAQIPVNGVRSVTKRYEARLPRGRRPPRATTDGPRA